MSIPIDILDVNVDLIELSKKESKDDKLGKLFFFHYNGSKGLEVELPEMQAPFGAKIMRDFGIKVSVPLSFSGMEERTQRGNRLSLVHQKLIEIQDKIRTLLTSKPGEVFDDFKKKKLSQETLNERVKNFIVPSVGKKDGKIYADLFRTEFQVKKPNDEDAKTKTVEELDEMKKQFISKLGKNLIHDRDNNPISCTVDNVEQVVPWGTKIKPVVQFSYIWYAKASNECTTKCFIVHSMKIAETVRPAFKLGPDTYSDEKQETEQSEEGEGNEDEGDEYSPEEEMDLVAT
jgi:hypothetical protein